MGFDLIGLLVYLLIGFIVGMIAGRVVNGESFSWIGNLLVGIIGSFFGRALFSFFEVSSSSPKIYDDIFLLDILAAFVGAVLLAFVVRFIK